MKTLRLAIFICVAVAQLAVPGSMIWKRQRTLREGRVWKFRTAPVDPVDALRGRYLALRFAAEEFPRPESIPSGEILYVTLKEDGEGFAVVDQLGAESFERDNVVPLHRPASVYERSVHVLFSFDRYWLSENDAPAAERAYIAHSQRENPKAYVTVRIRGDDAAIEELFLGGKPLREYLRSAP